MTDVDAAILESLRSNIFVVPEVYLQQELSRAQQDVIELDVEISALLTQIRVLKKRRELSESRCANIKSLFVPIRRLPPEVLSEIFEHLVITGAGNSNDYHFLIPLRLTHICGYWRWLAKSMPSLWPSISLCPTNQLQLRRYQATLDHFLSHSATLPLSASITLSSVFRGQFLLDKLVDHTFRWKDIRIHLGGDEDPLRSLLRIGGASLTQLKTFEFLSDENFDPDTFPFLRDITCFGDAPVLTHVTLGLNWFPADLAMPWSQLTHLVLGREGAPTYLWPEGVFETLRECTELTHLDIVFSDQGLDYDQEQVSHEDRIVLHNLQSLRLLGVPRDDLLFQQLIAPNLAHFTYKAYSHYSLETSMFVSSLPSLQTCIARSQCTITSFDLTPTDAPAQDILDWLDCLPCLREVTIDVSRCLPQFQEAIVDYFLPIEVGLSFKPEHVYYTLPMLERITLKGPVEFPLVAEYLFAMIQFRCGFSLLTDLPSRLVVATFNGDLCTVLSTDTRLKDCIEAGFHLNVGE